MFHRVRRTITDQLSTLASSLPGSPAVGSKGSTDHEAEMTFAGATYRSLNNGGSVTGITAPTALTHGRSPIGLWGPWGALNTSPTPRSRLVQIWLFISPLTTILLVVAVLRMASREPPPEPVPRPVPLPETLNPYACAPKSNLTALSEICTLEQNKGKSWREAAEGYEAGHDRHLTQAQCDNVFPGLYLEIDRAVAYWKKEGGVTLKHLDEAEKKSQARVLIKNNRLYVKSYSDEQQGTRTKAVLASIRDAMIGSLEPLPDVEFVVQTGDTGMPAGAAWALGRREKEPQLTLMPDFGFFSLPEPGVGGMVEVADKCKQYEQRIKWADKVPKLFWKGAFMVDIRKELWDIARKYKWGAVSDLEWGDKSTIEKEVLAPEEHCAFKYLGHVEGFAYSGRGKQLLKCRSVFVTHRLKYIQHFHHLFNSDMNSPDQNIVLSPGHNFDELPATMQWLIENDDRAEQIADTSYNFFRHYLSPASVDCYWRRLLQQWAELMTFDPELPRDSASYESFILIGKTKWVPF
ncbi:BQ5605_C002g01614 [Microbotryum silenes-dioicae]|uniref:BQ5605_C002g01614 protein n=1 Tax=Microbotryum silenes-dioicae TaxID=796604 RepID=A0A2X0NWQ6_9BASI|nr:BQ5605_C002g01614 [Microbotryum silenes-dioicae]